MTGKVFSRAVRPPYDWGALVYHTESLGVRSLPIALLTSTFAGLVISLQFGFFLARFGVQYTVGRVVVLTLFRELAPVLTALTVGARIGSGMAAELGAMTVTEQVDAIRALGADPLRKLVVPRVLACLLVLPTLTVLADVIGLVAGALVVNAQYGISLDMFFQGALDTVLLMDFVSGVIKGAVFGVIIGLVGCFKGLTVEGGTEGVGRATTQTVAIYLRLRLPGRLLHHQAHALLLATCARPPRSPSLEFHQPTPGEELIRFEHLKKSFGPKRVYRRPGALGARGRDAGGDRRLGHGQERAAQVPHRPAVPGRGAHPLPGAGPDALPRGGLRRGAPPRGHGVPGRGAVRLAHRGRERGLPAARALPGAVAPRSCARRVAEKLALVNLPGTEGMMPADLSGGMRKRVGLARAIATDPEVILWDEPTTGPGSRHHRRASTR